MVRTRQAAEYVGQTSGCHEAALNAGDSVDAARSRNPFAFLSGHRGDAVEVCVVVQNDQAGILGRRSDQEVRHFSSPLASTREHPLHLARPLHMTCLCLNQVKRAQSILELVPFAGTPR